VAQPFIGEIRIFAGSVVPTGWAECNGQLLLISQNTALFQLLGTNYGGDGQTTFGLPDLRGRVPLGTGTGPGLSTRTAGEAGGAETVTLDVAQIPAHTHTLTGTTAAQDTDKPGGASPSAGGYYSTQAPATAMNPAAIASAGGGQAHPNVQPFLGLNFIISLFGIFPS
jgi:microcystin-dependent protein